MTAPDIVVRLRAARRAIRTQRYDEALMAEAADVVERLSAGIAEMEAASFELHWRPIDSVPTDGTRVLLCDAQGRIAIGACHGDRTFADGRGFVGPAAHWMPLPKAAPPAWPVMAP